MLFEAIMALHMAILDCLRSILKEALKSTKIIIFVELFLAL